MKLTNKQIQIPELDIKKFDETKAYTIEKKTRKGTVKILKPEYIKKIKARLNEPEG